MFRKMRQISFLIAFTVLCGCASPGLKIESQLEKPYEQNADQLMTWIKKGEYDKAEKFLDHVVKNNIRTRDGIRYLTAVLNYWFHLLERKNPFPEDFLPYLDKWIEKRPASANALIVRGCFYIDYAGVARGTDWARNVKEEQWKLYYERREKALQDINKAYRLDPGNLHSSRQMLRIAGTSSDSQGMDEILFQRVIALDPNCFMAYRSKLWGLMPKWGGNWRDLFQFARQSSQNAPPKTLFPILIVEAHEEAAARSNFPQDKIYYNSKYLKPTPWEEIEKAFKRVTADFPKSVKWRIMFAEFAGDAEKFAIGLKTLVEAVKIDPDNPRVYELKQWFEGELGQWAQKEKSAQRLTELQPDDVYGWAHLAWAQKRLAKYKEASYAYTQAVNLEPEKFDRWSKRASNYMKMKEYEKAANDFSRAFELDPSQIGLLMERSRAYAALGNRKASNADRQMYRMLLKKRKNKS